METASNLFSALNHLQRLILKNSQLTRDFLLTFTSKHEDGTFLLPNLRSLYLEECRMDETIIDVLASRIRPGEVFPEFRIKSRFAEKELAIQLGHLARAHPEAIDLRLRLDYRQ